jgi:hypothetical protein
VTLNVTFFIPEDIGSPPLLFPNFCLFLSHSILFLNILFSQFTFCYRSHLFLFPFLSLFSFFLLLFFKMKFTLFLLATYRKQFSVDGREVLTDIFDTAGQEDFSAV